MNPDGRHVLYPYLKRRLPRVERGEGIYLYDADGKKYIDGCSGAITANIGHGVREVADAMAQQAARVAFVFRMHFSSAPLEQLAEEVATLTPGTLKYCFFANSGSEASELAMKVARQYWLEVGKATKYWMLSRQVSYHGGTLGALSLSGHPLRRRLMVPLLYHFPQVPAAYCYRCYVGLTFPECRLRCADELEKVILSLGPQHVAAFFVEPIVGASGAAIVPPDGYFARVREICDRYEVLLVADEVMTGFGRTGRNFGMDHWGVVPDIMVVGKGISGGYAPLAGIVISERIYSAIRDGTGVFLAGHTLCNNPLSCAVGVSVLRYLRKNGLVERAAALEPYLRDRLQEVASNRRTVGDVRGRGLFFGLEFVRERASREPFPGNVRFTDQVLDECFRRGLILYPSRGMVNGGLGDAILIAPPLTVTKAQIDELVEVLNDSLAAVEGRVL